MTIKPLNAPTTKRSNDSEGKKESHVVQVGAGEQSKVNQAHRNVIDGHGKSPQQRVEVYDEIVRQHRCSPHKSTRSKRRDHHEHSHHHKRDRVEREKKVLASVVSSPSAHAVVTVSSGGSKSPVHISGSGGGSSPDHLVHGCQSGPKNQSQVNVNLLKSAEDNFSGYNSGDEHSQPKEGAISLEEWQRRDDEFAKCMNSRGYELKPVEEDGACLFRSISLQIYGDEGMHDVIRQHTMDYIYQNREYFSQFVTEDINSYIKRKRRKDSHGNHIEIQAISEIYSRPVEVYCYAATPINIFNSEQSKNGYPPLRLSYQRGSHYNAILDPYNATVGVGLGLAGYKPDYQTKDAVRLSEQLEIEQTMFEDKLKTTDWEATNEAIEEQIARESYLQWCRDNLQRSRATAATSTSTVTSAEAARLDDKASPSKFPLVQYIGNIGTNTGSLGRISPQDPLNAANGGLSPKNSFLEQSFTLSPKSLSQLAHNIKNDEIEYESDTTDMSSTSSVGHYGGGVSPTQLQKKASRRNGLRCTKKRRRDFEQSIQKSNKSELLKLQTRKSPLPEPTAEPQSLALKRSKTPDVEQQPCTSKQSNTPDKNKTILKTKSKSPASPSSVMPEKNFSNFYHELLEASYAEAFNESEMLQRAIQLSTQDYIEDQKRKFYGP